MTEAREFGRGFWGQPPACSFAGTTPCATPATQGNLAGRPGRQRQPLAVPAGAWAVGQPPATWPRRVGIRRPAEWRQGQRRNDGASARSGRLQCLAGSAESRRGQHGRRQRHPDIGLQLFTGCGEPGRPTLWAAAASAVGDRGGPFSCSSGRVSSLRIPAHPSAPLLSRLLPRTEPVTVCYRGGRTGTRACFHQRSSVMVAWKWKNYARHQQFS